MPASVTSLLQRHSQHTVMLAWTGYSASPPMHTVMFSWRARPHYSPGKTSCTLALLPTLISLLPHSSSHDFSAALTAAAAAVSLPRKPVRARRRRSGASSWAWVVGAAGSSSCASCRWSRPRVSRLGGGEHERRWESAGAQDVVRGTRRDGGVSSGTSGVSLLLLCSFFHLSYPPPPPPVVLLFHLLPCGQRKVFTPPPR